MSDPIVEKIVAARAANPEVRALALQEAALELEWMARGYAAAGTRVLMDAAARVRGLAKIPTIGCTRD